MTRALLALALLGCARGETPHLRPGCRARAGQWEQTSYAIDASAFVLTASGIAVDLSHIDAVADEVDACVGAIDRATIAPEAACPAGAPWRVERGCTTVVLVPGEPSCTRPGTWLLPDSAGTSCDSWGKPTVAPDGTDCSAEPCRWAVATQDHGRTVVVPAQQSYERLAEGLVRVATGCLYPWSDEQTAACSQIHM